jgi:enoyl-CoA hydratase
VSLLRIDRQGAIVVLTLDDPHRRNVLSTELSGALRAAVESANADASAKAIVITGEGRAFCAGARLEDLEAAAGGDTAAVHDVYAAFMAVAASPLPTIAAVNGPAVGAGLNLALACDMRLAGEDALFDTRFLQLGLHPGGGCTWMLLRAVGWAEATRMLLAGRTIRAAEAQTIGLATAAQNPLETALETFASLQTVPRELVVRTKATLRLAAQADHHTTFAHETAEQAWSLGAPGFADAINGLKAGARQRTGR